MPHSVQKRGSKYAIVKRFAGGKVRTVGKSATRAKAKASARIRDRKSKGR